MNDKQYTAMHNGIYEQARAARDFAASLDNEPNDRAAARQWHLIADSLFKAVERFDTMNAISNGLRK
jgi:hypothetical protein